MKTSPTEHVENHIVDRSVTFVSMMIEMFMTSKKSLREIRLTIFKYSIHGGVHKSPMIKLSLCTTFQQYAINMDVITNGCWYQQKQLMSCTKALCAKA